MYHWTCPGDVSGQYCSQTLWLDSMDGIFKPIKEMKSDSSATFYGTDVCQITKCQITLARLGVSQLLLCLDCPIPQTIHG